MEDLSQLFSASYSTLHIKKHSIHRIQVQVPLNSTSLPFIYSSSIPLSTNLILPSFFLKADINYNNNNISISINMTTSQYHEENTQLASPQEYDMEPSSYSLSSYARSMHQHTKKQMDAAAKTARRRSPNELGTNAHGSLGNQSSVGSMESRSSQSSR